MDAIQMFLARHVRIHARVDGLTDGQIRGHAHPAANPLAWLLWHMARSEDASVNLLIAAGPQVLDATWARLLNVPRRISVRASLTWMPFELTGHPSGSGPLPS